MALSIDSREKIYLLSLFPQPLDVLFHFIQVIKIWTVTFKFIYIQASKLADLEESGFFSLCCCRERSQVRQQTLVWGSWTCVFQFIPMSEKETTSWKTLCNTAQAEGAWMPTFQKLCSSESRWHYSETASSQRESHAEQRTLMAKQLRMHRPTSEQSKNFIYFCNLAK